MAVNYLWHPFTRYETGDEKFPIIKKARGAKLYLEDGQILLDFISSWWTILHGHGEKQIIQAVHKQLKKLDHVIFANFSHEGAENLAKKLCQKTGYEKVFFSDNGSTAVEVAIKMAIQTERNQKGKRNLIVSFENSYHGDTFGAMSCAGKNLFTLPFSGYLFPVQHLPSPLSTNYKKLKFWLKKVIAKKPLIFIYEPLIQAAGGMVFQDLGILEEVLYTMKQAGAYLIADEVFTGFYRTGTFLASEQLTTKPDFIALAKALTGGFLPLGATLTKDTIFCNFVDRIGTKTFYHGHSFTAYPAACAAAVANLNLLEKKATQRKIHKTIENLESLYEKLKVLPKLNHLRHRGMVLAFEVGEPSHHYLHHFRQKLYSFFLKEGLLIRPLGNTVYLLPSLAFRKKDYEKAFFAIKKLSQLL